MRGNVYVWVYGSVVQVEEGPKNFEGRIEKSLGRDALQLEMVVGDRGGFIRVRWI